VYELLIEGTPAPQGSKSVNRRTGGMYEVAKALPAWKRAMASALIQYRAALGGMNPYSGPVVLTMHFLMPRPKSHYRTGRFSHVLKDSAPTHHTQKPDVDKLARAVADSLTRERFLTDDAVVTRMVAEKRWAEYGETPGVWFTLRGKGE
jgi:Holliday junction resolvase RusA-like endonuclease